MGSQEPWRIEGPALKMGRRISLALGVFVVVAACGGSPSTGTPDSGNDDQPSPTPTTTVADTGESTDDTGETNDDVPVSGLGEASVTMDGETFYFGQTSFPSLRCDPDMFGVFWVVLGQVDDEGNEMEDGGILQLVLVGEGSDFAEKGQVSQATFDLPSREQNWIADPEEIALGALEPDTSQVDEFTVDGNTVSGRASFFERETWFAWSAGTADDYLVATATFEANCSG